jgi:hypothetical protein
MFKRDKLNLARFAKLHIKYISSSKSIVIKYKYQNKKRINIKNSLES